MREFIATLAMRRRPGVAAVQSPLAGPMDWRFAGPGTVEDRDNTCANSRTAGIRATIMSIQVGHVAPDFTTEAHVGRQISLAEFRGRKVVVLYFYPKDESTVCTKEACSFRDAYEDFVQAGAVVIGVSSDSVESHQAFASGHRLPFILLADTDGSLRGTYGVPRSLGILPGRVTYVIDKQGVVRHIFSSQLSADRHVAEALSMVRQLAQS